MQSDKSNQHTIGNYFESFAIGQIFQHGVDRTLTQADASLYIALTGSRFAINCADTLAKQCGYQNMPLDNLLVFHIAFGKTVNDISLNAIANLGYAEVKFHQNSYAGDTLSVSSEVIGLKQNSNGKSGIVYVRSTATNQNDEHVVSWIRWVMVAKSDPACSLKPTVIPAFKKTLTAQEISREISADKGLLAKSIQFNQWQSHFSDNQIKFDQLNVASVIDHQYGITLNHSEHSMATRLYQNNAQVHFDQHKMQSSASGQRLIYGGHIISLCRSLSYNGLANAILPVAINGGSHTNPCYAGDTIYALTEVIDKQELADRNDVGLVRLRLLGYKNPTQQTIKQIPVEIKSSLYNDNQGKPNYAANTVLDIDYWALFIR
jgi:2-methylfumaryl-CoA hydratase